MKNIELWFESLVNLGSGKMQEIGAVPFLAVMLVSLFCSLFVMFLYTRLKSTEGMGSLIHRSFPLLAISITAIFICIQFSLPLSLGLLGALSIVRFRTPIKEPEEIGFILLVIATSLCCATFNFIFLAVVLAVAVAACLLLSTDWPILNRDAGGGIVVVNLPDGREESRQTGEVVERLLAGLQGGRIDSISEEAGEAVITASFGLLPEDSVPSIRKSVKNACPDSRISVFYDRPANVY